MTTTAGINPTLIDWSKQYGPDGKIMRTVEMLSQTNEMLEDMVFIEANDSTCHQVRILTGLPEATWRQFDKGVKPSKSTKVRFDIGTFTAHSVVDEELADLSGDVSQFRMSESFPFMEAMNQEMQRTLLMGNSANDPTQFNGLAPRFNSKSATTGENVVDAKGTTANKCTSIWLVGWGENSVYGVFPKGSTAGLHHEDLGVDDQTPDGDGGYFSAYHDKWTWKAGLVVEDWRYVVRIANIDTTKLEANDAPNLFRLMVKAVNKIPAISKARTAFYVNRTIATILQIQAMEKANVNLTMGNEEGQPKTSFNGVPIRICDQIINKEAIVT